MTATSTSPSLVMSSSVDAVGVPGRRDDARLRRGVQDERLVQDEQPHPVVEQRLDLDPGHQGD